MLGGEFLVRRSAVGGRRSLREKAGRGGIVASVVFDAILQLCIPAARGFGSAVRLAERLAGNEERGMRNVQYGVRNAECRMPNAECRMPNAECEARSAALHPPARHCEEA